MTRQLELKIQVSPLSQEQLKSQRHVATNVTSSSTAWAPHHETTTVAPNQVPDHIATLARGTSQVAITVTIRMQL